MNFNNNFNNQQNTYPHFDNVNTSNNQNANNGNLSSLLEKVLPLLLSGKSITDILPNLTSNSLFSNPIFSQILSSKNDQNDIKIESDKIDISSLTKC